MLLEAERATLERERAGFEAELVAAPADQMRHIAEHIARREARLREIDNELADGEREAAIRRAVDHLGQWAGDIRRDVTRLEKRYEEGLRHIEALLQANMDARAAAMRLVYVGLGVLAGGEVLLGLAVWWLVSRG